MLDSIDDDAKPHLAGWLHGRPVYVGTEGEWRRMWADAVKRHTKGKQVLTIRTLDDNPKAHERLR